MVTYDEEDQILFSCDAFVATGFAGILFVDEQ
jgi:flavorubredoxin